MMKKTLLLTTMLVLAVSATACSKKVEETTAAPTTEATTAATTAATEATTAEIEETYMSGVITKFTDTMLTVLSDDDGSEKDYDISKATIEQDFPFSEGDAVEISYDEANTKTPVPAMTVSVLESVIGVNTDPSVSGVVEDATTNTITLKLEDGKSYTFNRTNAYIVAKDGILVDKKATVTFIGDVEDTDPAPLAVKVVMEDSYDSTDAALNAFVGAVASIEENAVVLESADGDFYTFKSDSVDFSSCKVGDTVKVFYEGTVTAKEITATKLAK